MRTAGSFHSADRSLIEVSVIVRFSDQCGHYPHWELPEVFATAVHRFLIQGPQT